MYFYLFWTFICICVCPMFRPSLACVCLVSSANARTREPLYMELQKPSFSPSVLPTEDPAETVSSSSNTTHKYKIKTNTNTNTNKRTIIYGAAKPCLCWQNRCISTPQSCVGLLCHYIVLFHDQEQFCLCKNRHPVKERKQIYGFCFQICFDSFQNLANL